MKKNIRKGILYFIDFLIIHSSYYIALLLRFDGNIDIHFLGVYQRHFLEITLIKLIVFTYFKMYKHLWRYAGMSELITIGTAVLVGNAFTISYFSAVQEHLPRSVYIIVVLIDLLGFGGIRMAYRLRVNLKIKQMFHKKHLKKVLIVGAGDAGAMIIRELNNHQELASSPVAIIDDDVSKENTQINGVPVVGQRQDIVSTTKRLGIDEIIIAVPSASKMDIRAIINECKRTKAKIKIVPGMYELINETMSIQKVREVEIKDILGRDEVHLDTSAISDYIEDKVVVVTGGGGSIGSELCRQIASFKPKKIVIIEIYENSVFEVQNNLLKEWTDLNLEVKIASVRDRMRIDEIFSEVKPEVVFHAAAHKHVPLMEGNPKAAIKNNVIGTRNVVEAAHKYGVKRFVLISTDKAVNPTNIMGASKRLCEMVIQSYDCQSETEFVAVRFGNVLGSNGSVVPIFKAQIAEGGPVTITHKEITRYFMTIPEATQLVLQAGSMARGGEIFILDMGESVKIVDLAEDLIRLSGYEPYTEIPIVFTGLRPGEKLYEELLMAEEGLMDTAHEKIYVAKPVAFNHEQLMADIDQLKQALQGMSDLEVKQQVSNLVPTYIYESIK